MSSNRLFADAERKFAYKASAAGRVNIIGEHVDYCGGKVFPAALSFKNTVYIRPNGTDKINIEWTTLDEKVTLAIDRLDKYKSLEYGNYQAGSLWAWQNAGYPIVGCDMLHDCTVPFGSGLSSSAAIEVSTIAAMCAVTGTAMDKVKIAIAAQRAEREYIGVNCGIMDQYASACGRAGHAMLLDCATLECEYVPINLGNCSFVIINCKKPHNLVESKYNERREQTEIALSLLKRHADIENLAEASEELLYSCKTIMPETIFNRAAHIVSECARVRAAANAMRSGDMPSLGMLLDASHESLKSLYEVTGRELDALQAAAQSHPACLGSRMTGGGFGGCTVSVVETEALDDFKRYTLEKYKETTGYVAEAYDVEIGDGITVHNLQK